LGKIYEIINIGGYKTYPNINSIIQGTTMALFGKDGDEDVKRNKIEDLEEQLEKIVERLDNIEDVLDIQPEDDVEDIEDNDDEEDEDNE
tara:strand:+ start:12442 stop:12708 length:267 start_codon:yes stop_codon:yes gene_type:complete